MFYIKSEINIFIISKFSEDLFALFLLEDECFETNTIITNLLFEDNLT